MGFPPAKASERKSTACGLNGCLPRLVNLAGRVEIWRGNRESRFQIPLIKPDVRISRIRLSDKGIT